jgi:hypothetical protein
VTNVLSGLSTQTSDLQQIQQHLQQQNLHSLQPLLFTQNLQQLQAQLLLQNQVKLYFYISFFINKNASFIFSINLI